MADDEPGRSGRRGPGRPRRFTDDQIVDAGVKVTRRNAGGARTLRSVIDCSFEDVLEELAGADGGRPVSPPVFYRSFETYELYLGEVVRRIFDAQERLGTHTDATPTLEDFIRDDMRQAERDAPLWFAMFAGQGNEEVERVLARAYKDFDDVTVPVYKRILAASGRRMRRNLDVRALARAITAVVEGLSLRRLVAPLPTNRGVDDVELAVKMASAVFEAFTEPAGSETAQNAPE